MKIIKNTSFQFVFLLLFLFLINIFSSYKFVRLDLTEDKLHSLTIPTIKLLNNLEDIVSVDVYLEGDDFPAELQKLNLSLKERLDEFKAYSGNNLKIRYINLDKDKELAADYKKQIYEEGLDPSYVQVVQDNKRELLEVWAGIILRQGEVAIPIQLLQGGEFTINQQIINRFNDRIEYKIIQGLLKLTRTSKKRISFLRGHQELDNARAWAIRNKLLEFYDVDTVQLSSLKQDFYNKSIDFAISSFDSIVAIGDTSFIIKEDTISLFDKQEIILGAKNYISRYFQIEYLNAKRRNPLNISEDLRALDNTDCLIVAKPKKPFRDKEKYIIDQYIMRGGKVLWLVDMMDVNENLLRDSLFIMSEVIEHDLDNMLYKYGARINKDIITDSRCAPVIRKDGEDNLLSWFFYPTVSSNNNELMQNVSPVKLRYASSVDSVGKGEVKKTVLLESSSIYKQFRQTTVNYKNLFNYNPENFDVPADKNNVPLALLLEGEFNSHFKGRDSDKSFKKFISDSAVKFKEKSIPTSMVVIGDGDIIKNDFINLKGNLTPVMLAFEPSTYGTADFVPKYGNSVFVLNVIDKLLGNDVLIPLRSRMKFPRLLDKKAITTDRKYWQMLNLFLPIISVALLGVMIVFFRKRKFAFEAMKNTITKEKEASLELNIPDIFSDDNNDDESLITVVDSDELYDAKKALELGNYDAQKIIDSLEEIKVKNDVENNLEYIEDEKSENDKNLYDLFYLMSLGDMGQLTINLLEMPKPTYKNKSIKASDEPELVNKELKNNVNRINQSELDNPEDYEEFFLNKEPFTGLIFSLGDNGQLQNEYFCKKGVKDGIHTHFHDNGTIKYETSYQNGKWHGKEKRYNEDGLLEQVITFKNGIRHGEFKEYGENGILECVRTMKNGEENGILKIYHETGEIYFIGQLKAGKPGKPHGLFTYYHKDGQIQALRKFKNGEIIEESLPRIPDYESDEYEKNNEGSLSYINYTLEKNGELQTEMVCVNDKLVETRMYEKGIISVRIGSFGEEHYENGKLV